MSGWLQNLRYSLRQLRKSPGFSLAVLSTLALAIGVNAAVFSLLDGFLLRPLPYPQADRLGVLLLHSEGTVPGTGRRINEEEDSHDGDTWNWLRDNLPTARIASYGSSVSGVNLSTSSSDDAGVRYVENMRVSAHYFDVLGTPLFLGREFTEDEDRHNGPAAVMVSYELWRSALRSDRHIVGKQIQLKGASHTVVGVLAPRAQTQRVADVWTPLQPAPSGECGGENCGILMRLLPGATWQQVNAQLTHLRNRNFDLVETKYKGHMWFHASPMEVERGREARAPVLVLMLAVSFILLIGCANLAGLMLVRMARRTPEIATRLALGATRATVLRQLWMENLVLALLGGGAGLGLAVPLLKFLGGFLPPEAIPVGGLPIDGRVLLFTFAAASVTSVLFGALPVLKTWRVDMRPSVASRSVSHRSGRLRPLLISGEVALTMVLLAGAGVLIRSLFYLETLPTGFDPGNVVTAKASLDVARYHDASAFHNLLGQSVAAIRQIPGVEDAALGLSVPYERGLNYGARVLDGEFAGQGLVSSVVYVTPEYFDTLRIPMLSGREFREDDTPQSEFVTIVNQAFARRFFDESNPIGRHLEMDGNRYRIVGVVANVIKQQGIGADAPIGYEPVYYVPSTQMAQGTVNIAHVWFQPSWIVRTSKPPAGIRVEMQKALAQIDPTLPFSGVYSMSDILNENLEFERAQVLLLGVLAGLALLLSAVGIYALVANLIAQRTREIGIRLALGAQVNEVMVEISKSGLVAAAAGLLLGLALAMAAVGVLRSQIYGVHVYDALTFAATPVLLAAMAVAASFAPTLRITRIDPAETLRVE